MTYKYLLVIYAETITFAPIFYILFIYFYVFSECYDTLI